MSKFNAKAYGERHDQHKSRRIDRALPTGLWTHLNVSVALEIGGAVPAYVIHSVVKSCR